MISFQTGSCISSHLPLLNKSIPSPCSTFLTCYSNLQPMHMHCLWYSYEENKDKNKNKIN